MILSNLIHRLGSALHTIMHLISWIILEKLCFVCLPSAILFKKGLYVSTCFYISLFFYLTLKLWLTVCINAPLLNFLSRILSLFLSKLLILNARNEMVEIKMRALFEIRLRFCDIKKCTELIIFFNSGHSPHIVP